MIMMTNPYRATMQHLVRKKAFLSTALLSRPYVAKGLVKIQSSPTATLYLPYAQSRRSYQTYQRQPSSPTSGTVQQQQQQRCYSVHGPMVTPSATSKRRPKVTLTTLRKLYRRGEPITVLTAHDFPSGHVADASGMDMILVGDSLAMVALGYEDTSAVTLDDMLLHCRSVARAAKSSFLVGDLPMGSYELDPKQALASALRLVKEGHVHAVKLEGGRGMASAAAQKITQDGGIPVVGHIGLTPQRQCSLGGFRVQGKTAVDAERLLDDALALQEAGCFSLVLEAVPEAIATLITQRLRIPTIGIGAGNGCSGQVLVQIDMTGHFPPGRFLPKFVKQYGNVWGEAEKAIAQYREEVKSRAYPSQEYTYPMEDSELEAFQQILAKRKMD